MKLKIITNVISLIINIWTVMFLAKTNSECWKINFYNNLSMIVRHCSLFKINAFVRFWSLCFSNCSNLQFLQSDFCFLFRFNSYFDLSFFERKKTYKFAFITFLNRSIFSIHLTICISLIIFISSSFSLKFKSIKKNLKFNVLHHNFRIASIFIQITNQQKNDSKKMMYYTKANALFNI